ncbi:hypothetical protein CEXT_214091 [Caerostris extrusa]|uniref:Uncharacterized protein n=1 Tax=Caerostris extrusa TaxID=172846 RepID=A0AAV4Y838_CAEEX|nr:hypothetical protein CEXT_214091 [Caerostris extrusa]
MKGTYLYQGNKVPRQHCFEHASLGEVESPFIKFKICQLPSSTAAPTEPPTEAPTEQPSEAPTEQPSEAPTEQPSVAPTEQPSEAPSVEPETSAAP